MFMSFGGAEVEPLILGILVRLIFLPATLAGYTLSFLIYTLGLKSIPVETVGIPLATVYAYLLLFMVPKYIIKIKQTNK